MPKIEKSLARSSFADIAPGAGAESLPEEGRLARGLYRGLARSLAALGYSSLPELTLRSGRRVDLMALNEKGRILVVEIKVSLADLRADRKWPDYLGYCDAFYFAVPPAFPLEALPSDMGLLVADSYGAEMLREGPRLALAPARRRALTLLFARSAAKRLQLASDPAAEAGRGPFTFGMTP